MNAQSAACALYEASQHLLAAVQSSGAEPGSPSLERALERRREAFERLRATATEPVSQAVKDTLAEVQALDERIRRGLRARMATVREEIEVVRSGRSLAKQVQASRGGPPARFVSRRV